MSHNPRIITGKYKGNHIEVPDNTRPVTDRVKTYIFDKLGDLIKNSVVLDIFAGSGNLGIEALSRGASYVTFIDKNSNSCKIISKNLTNLQVPNSHYSIECVDFDELERDSEPHIIFVDPPFKTESNFEFSKIANYASKETIIVLKVSKNFDQKMLTNLFKIIEHKKLGENKVLFAQLV